MIEREAFIILNAIGSLGNRKILELIKIFGTVKNILFATQNELERSGQLSQKATESIFKFPKYAFLKKEIQLAQKNNIEIVTIADSKYPVELRNIDDAPVVLYIRGQLPDDLSSAISVVGSRNASVYGKTLARSFSQQLGERGFHIISGLAKGIDGAAHEGALSVEATTIAVIGCGHLHVYPREHEKLYQRIAEEGAIISEFPLNTLPMPYNFPRRNRIISGLSGSVLVVEAALKSGALITADFAAEQGKNVYAIPGPIDRDSSAGTHQLIKEGAKMVTSLDDILEDFDMEEYYASHRCTDQTDKELSEEEGIVYKFVNDRALHLDEIVKELGMPSSGVSRILLNLELKNLIKQLPGKYFRRS